MRTIRYADFIPQNVAPEGFAKIGLYNAKGKRMGGIDIGGLAVQNVGRKLYSFGAISDVHLQSNTAKDDFEKALNYFNRNDISFVCICGDLTDSGSTEQLTEFKQCVENFKKPIYAISGNHESYSGLDIPSVIQTYTGKPFYYSFEQGDDVFIMLGIKNEYDLFTDDELQWLSETLETNKNRRCFVFQHVFNGKENQVVCGNPYGLYHNYCWNNETQTAIFESLMGRYTNAIFFHGHSHFRFNMQSKNCTYANIDRSKGYWSIHIPSIAIPREDANGDGTAEYYTDGSEGYVIDVYKNHIVLKGRDFAKGVYLPIATYCLDTLIK